MASLNFGQAKQLVAPYVTGRGPSDPAVGTALNFVNERFITSGQWRGNRFITKFQVNVDSNGYYYFDTVAGVESVIQAIAVDFTQIDNWEIAEIESDFYQFRKGGLGWISNTYTGDTQILRMGNVPAGAGPQGGTVDTQRYQVIGKVPETRTMYCLVRRGYVPLVNDTDLLIPSNRNAYRYGVQAFAFENANELERAETYWQMAYKCLNDETIAFEEGENDTIEIQMNTFALSSIQNLI